MWVAHSHVAVDDRTPEAMLEAIDKIHERLDESLVCVWPKARWRGKRQNGIDILLCVVPHIPDDALDL